MSPVFTGSPLVGTPAGHHLQTVARDETPARYGTPAGPADDTARRVWEIAFGLMVRRRFDPDSPLAEVSRIVARAVHEHGCGLPPMDAEMLVRAALHERVPTDDIDPAVRVGTHLRLFAALADELALTDGELDGLITQAEDLAAEPDRCADDPG